MTSALLILPQWAAQRMGKPIAILGNYCVFEVEGDGYDVLRYRLPAAISLSSYDAYDAPIQTMDILEAPGRRWAMEERWPPRERRAWARRGTKGRRGARPVPMARLWGRLVYATADVPDAVVRAAVATRMVVKETVWRRAPPPPPAHG